DRTTQLSPFDASHLCATWNKGIMELSLSARKQDERSSGGKKASQTVFNKDMRACAPWQLKLQQGQGWYQAQTDAEDGTKRIMALLCSNNSHIKVMDGGKHLLEWCGKLTIGRH
ncbi:unnamed protein product, partial [Porites lobata]